MGKRNVEILAPAGSFESMVAAVNAGADAVYIGGSRFGARAYANNLDEEMMIRAIDYVHLHGKKIYLTVNTLLKEQEIEELVEKVEENRKIIFITENTESVYETFSIYEIEEEAYYLKTKFSSDNFYKGRKF